METVDVIEKRKEEIKRKIGDKSFYFIYKIYLVGFNLEDLDRINKRYGKDKSIEIEDIVTLLPNYSCGLKMKGKDEFYELLNIFNIDDVEETMGLVSNLLEHDIIWCMKQSIYTIDEFASLVRDDSE